MRILDRVWLGLAALLLLLTLASCICVATVFVNPDGVFTSLAGPTVPMPALLNTPVPFHTPTEVITFPTLPPEWTPTTEPSPTEAQGLLPESTSTERPDPIGPTATDTEVLLETRTPTATVPRPTRTRTPGSYPAGTATPIPPTRTPGGYP